MLQNYLKWNPALIVSLILILLAGSVSAQYQPRKPTGKTAQAPITVMEPTGSETWEKGKQYTIKWRGSAVRGPLKIVLENAAGRTVAVGESVMSSGSFTWTVGSLVIEGSYKVVVTGADKKTRGESNGTITIQKRSLGDTLKQQTMAQQTQPEGGLVAGNLQSLSVTSPSGGEIWNAGEQQTVTWSTVGEIGEVRIDLLKGDRTLTISGGVSNSGSYQLKVPGDLGVGWDDYWVRVSSVDGNISGTSQDGFTIYVPTEVDVVGRTVIGANYDYDTDKSPGETEGFENTALEIEVSVMQQGSLNLSEVRVFMRVIRQEDNLVVYHGGDMIRMPIQPNSWYSRPNPVKLTWGQLGYTEGNPYECNFIVELQVDPDGLLGEPEAYRANNTSRIVFWKSK